MTAAAHARSRGLARLADLFRGHRRLPDPPDLVPVRWRDFGDGPKITGLDYDTSYDHPGWEHDGRSVTEAIRDIEDIEEASAPPWDFAAPAAQLPPGSLAGEYQRWYGWDTTLADVRQPMARPYAPTALDIPGRLSPAAAAVADDYRSLPVFRAVVRGACRAGLTGLGTRGAFRVPPPPDWGLDRFTADAGGLDDLGPEWDQVAEHAEAGFYRARRVFHSADTAGFPAVMA